MAGLIRLGVNGALSNTGNKRAVETSRAWGLLSFTVDPSPILSGNPNSLLRQSQGQWARDVRCKASGFTRSLSRPTLSPSAVFGAFVAKEIEMQMIDANKVHELLEYEGLVEAIRQAHLGGMPKTADRIMYQEANASGHPDSFIILPAWQPQEGLLCKLVTSFPGNRKKHGISNVNSIYAYIDGKTGITEAVIDGEAMIFRKTSADSALGANILARQDAKILLMVGAGGLAPYLVRAHRSVRPSIETVLVWNRTKANADQLAELLTRENVNAVAIDDLDDAANRADIVSTATMAAEPILKGQSLKPGAHVDLVGSFTPEMREADDDVLRRCDVFVDHRQTTERSGEFLGPFARGVIGPQDIKADLFQLCQGSVPGRTSPEQITMMKNGGGSHIDYYVAKYLVDRLNGRAFSTTCAS